MCATWDEFDATELEEESDDEEALMCLRAFGDNQHRDSDSIEVNDCNTSYDKLLDAFEELHDDMKKLYKKNSILENECVFTFERK